MLGETLTIAGYVAIAAIIGTFIGLGLLLGFIWLVERWVTYCEDKWGNGDER